ncbi:GIY-YIG nuclease family protein [Hellea sp.]|nr:GIY-YIG nuclease family protein [Hellea sp.]
MSNIDLDELEAELGGPIEVKASPKLSAEQARVVAGFEDILKFYDEHGHAPRHGEGRDIFERMYAAHLDALRRQPRFHDLLTDLDKHGLLNMDEDDSENVNVDQLFNELGGLDNDVTTLRHVKARGEIARPDEVAERKPCTDFERFEPLFNQVRADLKIGVRESRRWGENSDIRAGQFFVLRGQMAYVAKVGESFVSPNGKENARLRVVYDNGTESNLLLHSLGSALYKDKMGRRITDPQAGPLFAQDDSKGTESGTIYVLRSHSELPTIRENRDLIHKIGVTGGNVETRIANAENDATYLLAGVDVVAEYKLYDINRSKLETMIQSFFGSARLNIEIQDRFGKPVKPREWFIVPLSAIDEAVGRIKDRTIGDYCYELESASLIIKK